MYKITITELKELKNSLIESNNFLIDFVHFDYEIKNQIKENQNKIDELTKKYHI